MLNNVRNILFNAGRLSGVIEVLENISTLNCSYCPVGIYVYNGEVRENVSVPRIKQQAVLLKSCILTNNFKYASRDIFDDIYLYIKSKSDDYLHNYAIAISHRNLPDENLIEKARIFLILVNMLDCMDIDEYEWSIPKGWEREIDIN